MTSHIVITPEGKPLLFKEASTAELRRREFGGVLHDVEYEETKLMTPGYRHKELGPSGVKFDLVGKD